MKAKTIKYVTLKEVPARLKPVAQSLCDCMSEAEEAHFVDEEKDMLALFFGPTEVRGFFEASVFDAYDPDEQDDEEPSITKKQVAELCAWLRSHKLTLFVLR